MSALKLLQHGAHIKPQYVQGVAGRSTDVERSDEQLSGIIKRFDKKARACDKALPFGLIKAQYPNAIEYTGSQQGLRGISLTIAVICGAMFFAAGHHVFAIGIRNTFELLFGLSLYIFPLLVFFWTIRLELFCPADQPTIFDRKHRKVYRIFRETRPGLIGLFKPWPMRACEYDWDLIDVEHNAVVSTTGSTVTRRHALMFLVRRSATDPTIIDSFNIGNSAELGETTVSAVWEHIRRFMEENGPALTPGESLVPATPPQTLWQSLGAVGPIGPKYMEWWKDNAAFMVVIHIMFFFFVPMFLLWGFFNWLSYKTATKIEWPQEVLEAVKA
jgi:hypothetical protein